MRVWACNTAHCRSRATTLEGSRRQQVEGFGARGKEGECDGCGCGGCLEDEQCMCNQVSAVSETSQCAHVQPWCTGPSGCCPRPRMGLRPLQAGRRPAKRSGAPAAWHWQSRAGWRRHAAGSMLLAGRCMHNSWAVTALPLSRKPVHQENALVHQQPCNGCVGPVGGGVLRAPCW